ncbi:hypothetical protein NDU88_005244 [Pleurodeles waltl]|uniref:Uncharacterized protein n=1 Tax=Pleurodeles waltl TaxID=8319 RepID=A0AAV7ULB8_PLEWA|nr:hypothetical protein NDU88_005244 [Pleurodeles waltl]
MARESVRLLHTLAAHPQQKTTKVPRDFKYSSSGGALSRSKCPKAMKPKTQAITSFSWGVSLEVGKLAAFLSVPKSPPGIPHHPKVLTGYHLTEYRSRRMQWAMLSAIQGGGCSHELGLGETKHADQGS